MKPSPLTVATARAIRKLHHKKGRYKQKAFLVEGRKSVQALLASDYTVHTLVVTTPFLQHASTWLAHPPCPLYHVSVSQLNSLSLFQHNHEILAVAAMKTATYTPISPSERALVLDGIQDPGNLGTLMRIADWYGIKKIICAPHTVDPYNPKVIHASMGSFTQVEHHYTSLEPFLSTFKGPRIGMVLREGTPLQTTTWPPAGLLVVGSESHGLHPSLLPLLTQRISIQRHGHAESLNAAIATAIACEQWTHSH